MSGRDIGKWFRSNTKRAGRSFPAVFSALAFLVWLLSAPAAAATLDITVSSLPAGTVGQSYSTDLNASGGTGAYTWRAAGLPAGLRITSSNGTTTLNGTPTKAGTFSVALTVYDRGDWGTANLALTIYSALTVPSVTLPKATVGIPYSKDISGAGGGTGGYTWQAAGLPAGLAITSSNGTATISGTPAKAGTFTVALTLYDSADDKTTTRPSLTVYPAVALSHTNLPAATVGTPYSTSISASGGTGGYTWWADGLPPGLALTPSNGMATISGTPSQYGLFRTSISVRDSADHGAGFTGYLAVGYPSSGDTSSGAAEANIGVVGPDGGTVATPDGSVSVEVPSGAFSAQTVLSISQFATPYPAPAGFTPASPQWDISGGGTEPVQAVTISFTYDPTTLGNLDPARVGVYLYNPGTGSWHWLAGQAGDNTVTVNTFSLGVFAVQANTRVFQDMNLAPWAGTAVDALLGAGMVSGAATDRFAPLENVSRAQFAVMLARVTGLPPAADGRTPFRDVPPTAWYAPYVAAAFNSNLMHGTGAAAFSPDTPVTREEMAVMLARLPGTTSTATTSEFTDSAAIDSWARAAVDQAVGSGILSGFPDGTFQPLVPVNRAQAAVALYNYLQLTGRM